MKSLILVLFLLMFSTNSYSAVWEHDANESWDKEWQDRYSTWIATNFTKTFFKDLGKPFNTLRLDCADAQYGLQAYFSMINKLPFVVNKGKLSNMTTKFDHIKNEKDKLRAFIRHLSANYGTLSLAYNDTYSIGYTDINPGDIFMYNIGSTRHTYIIKNININGTFDVIYSTQAAAKEGRPFLRKKSFMFKKLPNHTKAPDKNSWGFRRMKMPQFSKISQYDVPGANYEQYDDARKLSKIAFFEKVRDLNSAINESPKDSLNRNFTDVCNAVIERKESVNGALKALKGKLTSCMNFNDYDAYSTPSRDSGLINDYSVYEYNLKKIIANGKANKLGTKMSAAAYGIFGDSNSQTKHRKTVRKLCNVNVKNVDSVIDLASFRASLLAGNVSFHPNDNKNRRWGIKKGNKTRCKEFYGYPE